MKDKIKKISKYVVNGLNMINMLLVVLSPIWGWNLDNVTKTIVGVAGVISTYLVSGKLWGEKEEIQTTFNEDDLENIDTEGDEDEV